MVQYILFVITWAFLTGAIWMMILAARDQTVSEGLYIYFMLDQLAKKMVVVLDLRDSDNWAFCLNI